MGQEDEQAKRELAFKDFSKMQRLLVCFDVIHYSYQIGTYWNSMAYITS
jgi:hypothetical protein